MAFCALLVMLPMTNPLASLRRSMMPARCGSSPWPLTRSAEKSAGHRDGEVVVALAQPAVGLGGVHVEVVEVVLRVQARRRSRRRRGRPVCWPYLGAGVGVDHGDRQPVELAVRVPVGGQVDRAVEQRDEQHEDQGELGQPALEAAQLEAGQAGGRWDSG